jgi:hypothetical protein
MGLIDRKHDALYEVHRAFIHVPTMVNIGNIRNIINRFNLIRFNLIRLKFDVQYGRA